MATSICPRSEASKANMLVLSTSSIQGATKIELKDREFRDITLCEDMIDHGSCVHNVSSCEMKAWNLKKKTDENPLKTISIDLFSLGGLFSHFRPRDIP